MMNLKAVPYIIIAGLLLIIFLMQQCDKDPEIIEIEVPAKKGEFEPEKPKHIDADKPTEIKWKDRVIEVPNPVNDSLEKAYRRLSDSLTAKQAELERWKMYVEAIQIRQYNQTFEDSLVKIDISGKVQGEIQEMQTNYTIKAKKVTAKQKQTVIRLLAGLEFGNNLRFNDFRYKANLGFQNAQGNILRVGYEKSNNQDYVFLGYDFSVFEIKR